MIPWQLFIGTMNFWFCPFHCLTYAVSSVVSYCLKVLFRQDKHLLAIHGLWSDFRSTSPVGWARLPWCYTEVGVRASCSKTVWFPRALLWAAGLGTTSMSLQGANYLSTSIHEHFCSCSVLWSLSIYIWNHKMLLCNSDDPVQSSSQPHSLFLWNLC